VELGEGDNKRLLDERDAEREILQRRVSGNIVLGPDGLPLSPGEPSDAFYANEALAMDAAATEQAGGVGGGGGGFGGRGMALAKSAAMTAAPAPMAAASGRMGEMTRFRAEKQMADKMEAGQPDEPAVQVRSDFRSTMLWQPDLKTDAKGTATVKVTYPDSLTGWKATARAASATSQFGIAETTTRTKQPLIVRLQAPRFFVVGDDVVLSAVVNNNTDKELEVKVSLAVTSAPPQTEPNKRLPQPQIAFEVGKGDFGAGAKTVTLKVPANGEARADWKSHIYLPGPLKLKATGVSGRLADAMEKEFVAHEHGIEKFITQAGKVRGKDITVNLNIPKERKLESTALVVQVTPSLAVTMLDSLPYLINYPYGCTEQTMSRFLPAVITAKTLKDLGLQPEDVMGRVFGGVEARAGGLQPPSPVGNAASGGKMPPAPRDLQLLNDMVKAGLDRLYDFQHGDGGWGWWKQGESDHWMTAYVVWGLTLAKQAGTEIKAGVIERGASFLDKELVEEEENVDMQAWMLHATVVRHNPLAKAVFTPAQNKAFDNLWKKRDGLNAYTRALLALAAHHMGKGTEARTLIANLENGVKKDDRPDQSVLVEPATPNAQPSTAVQGTAHWGEDGVYWRWSDGGVEATAWALRALLAIDPQNKLVEPVTNWLIKNRRGAQWSNTRDTAMVVLAMNDYLRVSGELRPDVEYELLVNGKSIAKREVKGADVFNAPSRFTINPTLIRSGDNKIQIKRRDGTTPVYFAAEATFFSLEEPVTAAGNEIFVKREYFRLAGRPTLLKGFVYDRVPLKDGETIRSGERIETVLTIESKNNYEYLIFEDLKPAGVEAVQIRSGESLYAREMKQSGVERKFSNQSAVGSNQPKGIAAARRIAAPGSRPAPVQLEDQDFTGRTRWIYQELRDRKVVLFIDKLPEGVWQVRYDFRAEIPGHFHALPVLGHAMYVPEIRCNGAEIRIHIEDAPKETERLASE
jgi:alpha-2-macroglobulin